MFLVTTDIGDHSDGWEPTDETDVRLVGVFSTVANAIAALNKFYPLMGKGKDITKQVEATGNWSDEISKVIYVSLDNIAYNTEDPAVNLYLHDKKKYDEVVEKSEDLYEELSKAKTKKKSNEILAKINDLPFKSGNMDEEKLIGLAYSYDDSYREYDDPWDI